MDTLPPLASTLLNFCQRTGISRSTAYELIAEGRLRPVKLGRRVLILEEEAQRFLNSLKTEEDGGAK